jgi:outer membrane protein assembly factor BamB
MNEDDGNPFDDDKQKNPFDTYDSSCSSEESNEFDASLHDGADAVRFVGSDAEVCGLSQLNRVIWRTPVKWMDGTGWSSADGLSVSVLYAVEEQAVVVGCDGTTLCLDRKTGRIRWNRIMGVGTFPGMVTLQYLSSGAMREDRGLLIAACNGLTFGLEMREGNFVWKCDVPGTRYQCISLLLHDDVVYCGSYGKVVKLDAINGAVMWKSKIKSSQKCHMTMAVETASKTLVVATHGRLANLDLVSGEIMWQIKIPKLKGNMVTQPSIATYQDHVYTSSGAFAFAINLTTGDTTWERDLSALGNDNASIAVEEAQLFVATSCHVLALDMADGKSRWCTHLPGLRQYLPTLLAETSSGTLVVAGGCNVCLLSMADGAPRGRDTDLATVSKDIKVASIASICSIHTATDPHGSPSAQVAAILRDLCQFGKRDSRQGQADRSSDICGRAASHRGARPGLR